jgi:hypothetical protein
MNWGDMTNALHDSAELSDIYLRGAQSFNNLDPVSKLGFSLNYFEAMYFAHRDGMLMGQSWRKIERTMCHLLAAPGVHEWRAVRRDWHTEEFATIVDTIIAKAGEPKALSIYGIHRTETQARS